MKANRKKAHIMFYLVVKPEAHKNKIDKPTPERGFQVRGSQ